MLSLAFLGHAAWSIIEIAAFASAASAILIGVIVILRRHWLNLLVPAVLLVLHVILGVTIAFAHDALNWGSPFASHQQIRRFAWIGLLPLIADCLLFASLGPLKRRTGAGGPALSRPRRALPSGHEERADAHPRRSRPLHRRGRAPHRGSQ